jgi:lysophospholipase L1-like esterase
MKLTRVEGLLAKLARGEQVTIVALGDSNTELTFHTRGYLNWCGLLQVALLEKYGPNRVIMINAACCGERAAGGLARLDRDVLRFAPDLAIVCYWDGDMDVLRTMVRKIRAAGTAEVLLRTPNPIVAPNQPRVTPAVVAGKEWPGTGIGDVARKILALGTELQVPVVDHYHAWLEADAAHHGPPSTNPNKLWMRMSDVTHPGPLGHVAFYRELAPFFGLSPALSWEF